MLLKPKIFLHLFLGVVFLFLYCEWFVYYVVLYQCSWPELDPQNEDPSINTNNEQPVRIIVLADTHLLGSNQGHWFDKLRREWQMYRTFQTAMSFHNPQLVFILGDVTDEGYYCSDGDFEYYIKRFRNLFKVPDKTNIYAVVGNHDIGFHYRITPYLNQRFVKGFNSTSVQLITLRGNHLVLVNSMSLEGDGCSLCRESELQLQQIENLLKCAKNATSQCVKYKKRLKSYSKPILMMHFPLYRKSDVSCNEPDEAPFPLKQKLYREGWDCLSKGATYQILRQLNPRIVLTGHSHHGCTRALNDGPGVEITLPSFSWRNKDNPSYGLLVLTPNNSAFSKCLMPRESTVMAVYIFGIICLLIYTIGCIYSEKRRRKFNDSLDTPKIPSSESGIVK